MEDMMMRYFTFNETKQKFICPKSSMYEYMKECDVTDIQSNNGPMGVKWTDVAKGEWDSLYDNFADYTIEKTNDPVIFAETLKMFYFDSDTLYANKL